MAQKEMATADAVQIEPADDTARMMEIAISQGEAGVAALERLVAMRERAEDRAAARQYAEAVGRFQELCPVVGKNAAGAHGAAYATLDQVMGTIRPALAEAGLGRIRQPRAQVLCHRCFAVGDGQRLRQRVLYVMHLLSDGPARSTV